MDKLWISLDSRQKLERFVAVCSMLDMEIEAASGEHSANAKSILGLMTLPLSRPLELRFQAEGKQRSALIKVMEPFLI